MSSITIRQTNTTFMKYPYQTLWFVISAIAIFVTYIRYNEVSILEKHSFPLAYKVTETYCDGRSGSSISINFKSKKYFLQCDSEKCYNTKVGSKINLFYYKRKDYFYIPGTINSYERDIYIALLSLILSVLPWSKLERYLNGDSR